MTHQGTDAETDRHIVSILLENEAGALSGVAGLFSARGYNIESLTVSKTDDSTLSRMTIVTVGSSDKINQIVRQLNKLVMVVEVKNLSDQAHIEREMILVKVACPDGRSDELDRLANEYGARIIRRDEGIRLLELMTAVDRGNHFMRALSDWEVIEVARSGAISLEI